MNDLSPEQRQMLIQLLMAQGGQQAPAADPSQQQAMTPEQQAMLLQQMRAQGVA